MKKILAVLITLTIFLGGCSQPAQNTTTNQQPVKTPEQKVEVDPSAETYTIKNTLTDWETGYAVKTDATYVHDHRGHYVYTVAEVTNLGNNPIPMSELAMEGYSLADDQGATSDVDTFECYYPAFLMPGQTGYLHCASNVGSLWTETPTLSVIWHEDGISQSCVTAKDLDTSFVQYETSNVSVCEENGDVRVKGVVSNNAQTAEGTVFVTVVLFDKQDQVLGLFTSLLNEIAPGDHADFIAVGSPAKSISVQDVASWKIEAFSYVDTFK